jgi:hypothetical protein
MESLVDLHHCSSSLVPPYHLLLWWDLIENDWSTILGVLSLDPCIVLNSSLPFVRARDRGLFTLVGRSPSWIGGWCSGYLFVEDCEEARAYPSWTL